VTTLLIYAAKTSETDVEASAKIITKGAMKAFGLLQGCLKISRGGVDPRLAQITQFAEEDAVGLCSRSLYLEKLFAILLSGERVRG
jgi:hypothetical protein